MPSLTCIARVSMGLLFASIAGGCASASRARNDLPEPDPVGFGTVLVDAGRREVIVTGYVNQVEGAIELLACGTGGKVHESIFVLQAEPRDIQAAFLLLGLKGGEPVAGLGQGPPTGDPLHLEVLWVVDGKTHLKPAESFIFDYMARRPARHGGWLFTGSMIKDGYFMADAEESIVATYWDPWAIVNIKELGGDDERLSVNKSIIPPRLTPIQLIFRALP